MAYRPQALDRDPPAPDGTLPAPLLMNCWKHHAATVLGRIDAAVAAGEAGVRALPARLLSLGDALADFYLGSLPVATIAAEVLGQLRAQGVAGAAAFAAWVAAAAGYRTLELSDGSRWVLRESGVPHRHVHIHPARHSAHSTRAPARQLRSAIVALAWAGLRGRDPLDVAVVDEARVLLLQLPPLGALAPGTGVGELLRLLACRQALDSNPPPGSAGPPAPRGGTGSQPSCVGSEPM